jgi:hypothetical protein
LDVGGSQSVHLEGSQPVYLDVGVEGAHVAREVRCHLRDVLSENRLPQHGVAFSACGVLPGHTSTWRSVQVASWLVVASLWRSMWLVMVGGDNGELRSWHFIYVRSIESRLIMCRRRPRRTGGATSSVGCTLAESPVTTR